MGFGSISSMITTLKTNKSLLREKKRFKSDNRKNTSDKEKKLEFKQVSEEELDVIKQRIHEKIKREKRKNLIILVSCSVLVIMTLLYLLT